jgi:hypothetical protein
MSITSHQNEGAMDRVLNKIKGTGNPPSLKILDSAHVILYMPLAILSSVIGHKKEVIEGLKVNRKTQKDSTGVLASVEINGKWQYVYPQCKDVYTGY